MHLAKFSRKEFKNERWDYQPGEHVADVQPSQGGKTHWMYDLAGATDWPDKPPVSLVIKAVDSTPAHMTRRLGWKETPVWPPAPRRPWQPQPTGYTLWPKHDLSMRDDALERTQANQRAQIRRLFLGARKGGQPIIAGELYGLLAELGMRDLLIEGVTRGSSARSPIWYDTQKASGTQGISLPGFFLNCPMHYFFGYDPVEANRKKISEIGGINSAAVMDIVGGHGSWCPPECDEHISVVPMRTPSGIRPISELLYINKNGPRGGYMCIVSVF
jgi:hypothetical protein